jgi:hypothetical protein
MVGPPLTDRVCPVTNASRSSPRTVPEGGDPALGSGVDPQRALAVDLEDLVPELLGRGDERRGQSRVRR